MTAIDSHIRRTYLEVIRAPPAHVRPRLQAIECMNQPSVVLLPMYSVMSPKKLHNRPTTAVCGRSPPPTHRIDAHGRAAIGGARAVDVVAAVARGAVRLRTADSPGLLLRAPEVRPGG